MCLALLQASRSHYLPYGAQYTSLDARLSADENRLPKVVNRWQHNGVPLGRCGTKPNISLLVVTCGRYRVQWLSIGFRTQQCFGLDLWYIANDRLKVKSRTTERDVKTEEEVRLADDPTHGLVRSVYRPFPCEPHPFT